ncbi:MAG: hypothetical protein RI932_1384, partial [Pseudomonadota bacterium]
MFTSNLTVLSRRHLAAFFCMTAAFFAMPFAYAQGGYTSPGSRAFADANQAGDYLLAGDSKLLLRRSVHEAALKLTKDFPNQPSVVTGGLLERSPGEGEMAFESTRAIVCSETKLHTLSVEP